MYCCYCAGEIDLKMGYVKHLSHSYTLYAKGEAVDKYEAYHHVCYEKKFVKRIA